jgi:signal transduction histidine kinase
MPAIGIMDPRARHWPVLLALSAALGTALAAASAVWAIRQVLRQDLDGSAEGQTVIRVAKLRALAERLGGRARGFLLTADPESLDRVAHDRQTFFERVDSLRSASDGESKEHLAEVEEAGRAYDQALDAVIGLRRSGRDTETVARAFETTVRPRKEELDRRLAELIESEEGRLDSLDRSAERAASRLATTATGAAVGAFLVSLTLAILLARAFLSLRRERTALEQALARLAQANQELDAFAGRIAHDLRTPLTPIVLMANRLKRWDDERVVRAAARIERGAQAANRMLEGLLAFSRLGHRDEDAVAAAAPVIREAIDDLGDRMISAGVTLTTDLDEDAMVACGETLFRQVVDNLIGNAIKFMARQPTRQLSLLLRWRGPSCYLEVRDTGPGIPPEALAHIFDPFYRAAGAATPGTGLGLAIVRRIVEAHGGSVTASSEVGRGTTFQVILPAHPTAGERAPHPARTGVPQPSQPQPGLL